jgi:hypothetical protein
MIDQLILVHYIPRELLTETYRDELQKSLREHFEAKAFFYILPTDDEMRVECINPKLVDEKSYKDAKEALDKCKEIAEKLAEKGKSLL